MTKAKINNISKLLCLLLIFCMVFTLPVEAKANLKQSAMDFAKENILQLQRKFLTRGGLRIQIYPTI